MHSFTSVLVHYSFLLENQICLQSTRDRGGGYGARCLGARGGAWGGAGALVWRQGGTSGSGAGHGEALVVGKTKR